MCAGIEHCSRPYARPVATSGGEEVVKSRTGYRRGESAWRRRAVKGRPVREVELTVARSTPCCSRLGQICCQAVPPLPTRLSLSLSTTAGLWRFQVLQTLTILTPALHGAETHILNKVTFKHIEPDATDQIFAQSNTFHWEQRGRSIWDKARAAAAHSQKPTRRL